jgi:hypothetical protein
MTLQTLVRRPHLPCFVAFVFTLISSNSSPLVPIVVLRTTDPKSRPTFIKIYQVNKSFHLNSIKIFKLKFTLSFGKLQLPKNTKEILSLNQSIQSILIMKLRLARVDLAGWDRVQRCNQLRKRYHREDFKLKS